MRYKTINRMNIKMFQSPYFRIELIFSIHNFGINKCLSQGEIFEVID
jgi:hypothetical protein